VVVRVGEGLAGKWLRVGDKESCGGCDGGSEFVKGAGGGC
jgi:hypothetical protein